MPRLPAPAACAGLLLLACRAAAPMPLPDLDLPWDYRDPAATEARFRALERDAAPDADLGWRVELATQIARTYSLRARFDDAHATLDAVEPRLAEAGPVARARHLLERGRTYNSAGEPARAVPLFREAFEVADAAGAQRHAADALHMLGIAAPPDEAPAWNLRAIAYCERCTDERARRWLGPLYHNQWYAHLSRGELDLALAYAEKSRAYRASIADAEGERVGRWTIHHTRRKQGRIEEALEGFRALARDYGAGGDPSGFTQEELGECLLALGRPDEARPHFAAALAILENDVWIRRDEPERLERLRRLAAAPAAPSEGLP